MACMNPAYCASERSRPSIRCLAAALASLQRGSAQGIAASFDAASIRAALPRPLPTLARVEAGLERAVALSLFESRSTPAATTYAPSMWAEVVAPVAFRRENLRCALPYVYQSGGGAFVNNTYSSTCECRAAATTGALITTNMCSGGNSGSRPCACSGAASGRRSVRGDGRRKR
jgi:hypothetical protein